ncbi:TonB-dependent receptor [Bordetella genomosp. 5]|uniref:TonB-dependent receptor n=1 Tax=Bordetella genomosp. 5 TaxID=1395608 RepID=A0A261TW58_9BORD|nr:TonB-dependent receptor [Bordetella genomosp. 5]OZI53521.1 TonB-dependent receptor [Bordetella genomosp. 5]
MTIARSARGAAQAVLALSLALAFHPGAQAQTPANGVTLDLPAQPLGSALLSLGEQAGIELSFSPQAVAGKAAPAVRGTLTPFDALNRLLDGSGLQLRQDGPGRYQIYAEARNAFSVARLETVEVVGQSPEERVYSRAEIAATPTANRDLSSLVASAPAVRLGSDTDASSNRGSMNVQDISIHGASPYQNLFQIDGMAASSMIDPASKNLNLQVGNIPSNAQAYFVDTALVDSVRVLDNTIPVEYGHFTGGVIDAKLRRPSGENHLAVDYRWNTSKMTRQNVSEGDQEAWGQGEPGYAPEWKKRFYTAVGDIALGSDTGAILSMSRRESTIQRFRMGEQNGQAQAFQEGYDDRVDNFLGKFSTRLSSDTVTDLVLKYSDRRESLVSNFFRNTNWDNQHAARGVGWNLDHRFDGGRVSVQAGWDKFVSNRSSDATELVTQQFSDRRPQYTWGGFGKEEKAQQTVSFSTRVDLDPVDTAFLRHNLYGGVQAEQVDFNFERYDDAYSYRAVQQLDGSSREFSKQHYLAGTVDKRYRTLGLYASDRIEWGRVALTASTRMDRDTLLGNTDLSPRTRLDWDALGTGDTVLSAGWARYYGSYILDIMMREEVSKLRRQVLDARGNPVADGSKTEFSRYDGLRTPYDDEWAFSLRQRVAGLEGTLSYVRRNGRDQISKTGTSTEGYEYVNDGWSRTDSWMLSVVNQQPWKLGPTYWTGRASWSYQRSKRNTDIVTGYEDGAYAPDDYILYNGERILAGALPPNDFNQPQQVVLSLTGRWPDAGLTWNNDVRWRSGRNGISYLGLGPRPEYLERYESVKLPSYWTWDTRLTWEPRFARGLELSVDVLNVLNQQPKLTVTAPNRNQDLSLYRTGREIWLQAGYRF